MIQQFLMQFTGALNRRRAYAATHPMVLAAEERLHACATQLLQENESFTLGVARDELLVDGAPYVTKGTYARELATRLHRRGVGAITLHRGVLLTQLADLLAWLAAERDFLPFAPTRAGGVDVTTIGYDRLVLDDSMATVEASVSLLWRTLAALAEAGLAADPSSGRVGATPAARGGGTGTGGALDGLGSGAGTGMGRGTGTGSGIGNGRGPTRVDAPPIDAALEQAIDEAVQRGAAVYVDGEVSGIDTALVLAAVRASIDQPAIARRTAMALAEVAAAARGLASEARALVGQQLSGLLGQLGTTDFAPVINSLADRTTRTAMIANVADALPVGAVVQWLQSAAAATEQQMSHQILRIMTKLSVLADVHKADDGEAQFREAARELVEHWTLTDPNPTEHVELLDRIATFERTGATSDAALTARGTSIVETSRVVQMGLELDFAGDDTAAAAESLVESGAATLLLQWAREAGATRTARWLYDIAVSEKAVRQLLLTEPVDRLEARTLLEALQPASADMLLDVLERAEARGTRMIVRQRLAEFGKEITPQLMARLETAPWFLVRNILTLLQEFEDVDAAGSAEHLLRLLEHPQVQVRTEAVRVLLRTEQLRDAALPARALRDESERVVVLAIQSISELAEEGTLPSQSIVSQLQALVDGGAQSDPVRARAVRAVGRLLRDDVREWLVRLVAKRTRFLRRLKLLEPTQAAATALQILQRVHAADPVVAKVLALAAKAASDPRWQVRETTTERLS